MEKRASNDFTEEKGFEMDSPHAGRSSKGYHLHKEETLEGGFELNIDDDEDSYRDFHPNLDGGEEEEAEDYREGEANDDFEMITIEDGRRNHDSGNEEPLAPEQEERVRRLVRWAIVVSWTSVVLDLTFGCIALFIAIDDKSVGVLGFSLENFLDVITSFLIIWRFGGFSRGPLILGDPEQEDKTERREGRAEVLIALLFVLLGSFTCVIALIVLYENESPDDVVSVILLSSVSIVVLALLAAVKFYLSSALKSQAFRQDAWITTISSVLSIGLAAGSVIFHINSAIWFIDCLVALPLGGVLVASGLRTLFMRKWWQTQFWGVQPTEHGHQLTTR